jgi:copper chaperone CopZ
VVLHSSLYDVTSDHYAQLSTLAGVAEMAVSPQEGLLYVKIDKQKISESELRNAIEGGNLCEQHSGDMTWHAASTK